MAGEGREAGEVDQADRGVDLQAVVVTADTTIGEIEEVSSFLFATSVCVVFVPAYLACAGRKFVSSVGKEE